MADEPTQPMSAEDNERARVLSMQGLVPPVRVPRYEQERFLGKGTFGEVWWAVDSNNGRQVAIKFYHRRGGLDWALLSREVEKLRHLFNDRHVVQLFEVGWDSDPPYYVMEFMPNGSLEDRLREGPLTVAEAVDLFQEIAVGLGHAHNKGILHCDLKPANILLDQDNRPRLADFGQARLTREATPSLGTLFYMAPEQADLQAVPDARWDVYALGALLYCMLTGEPPYRGSNTATEISSAGRVEERLARYRTLLHAAPAPAAHRQLPDMDPALAYIIDRCLALDPGQRFPNVQAVLEALHQRRRTRSRQPLLVLGIVGPLLIVLVLALAAWFGFLTILWGTESELKRRAQESNSLAARSIAERVGLEIDRRFSALEQEATHPDLRRWLQSAPNDRQVQQEIDGWLAQCRSHWNEQTFSAMPVPRWIVLDRAGLWRGGDPPDETLRNRPFGWRDYFHGQGKNLPPEGPLPEPIRRPHRSMVYKRQGKDRRWTVTFTVPVFAENRDVVGVLGLSANLGELTKFRGTRDQFAVLVDVRPTKNGREPG